ncbi:MAG: glutamine synthetase [Kordiimonadaceae bacterium]|nr:glutamine synthetase [Kordiimonadaceae bacterium]
MKSNQDIIDLIKRGHLPYIKVGVFDIDGVLRGKYVGHDKAISALENGFGFCDVVLGWDIHDQLYDNAEFTGWHTGYPDVNVRLLSETFRRLPFEDSIPFVLGEFTDRAEAICPRGLLRRVIEKANKMGFRASAGCEFEFFVFDETPDTVREKRYHNMKSITPGNFGYSMLRSGVHNAFHRKLLDTFRLTGIELEGLHTETGPGVIEAAIRVDDVLAAADKASLFKTFTKIIAQQEGWMATFMAKWSKDVPGQSGHIHLSLQDKDGNSAFYDPKSEHGISETMRHFIGGQQALMPDLLSMYAPTVNSFRRLVPGFWAPTVATWGIENRTCALRAILGGEKSHRVECRVPGADINPYIAIAAALASGLYGIAKKLEPDDPVNGNAYDQTFANERQLPHSLWDAADRFKHSFAARGLFGDEFVDHYAATREWEVREFRKAITDWELERYFEII